MKQIATFLALCWLLTAQALSLKADNAPPDYLAVSISTVTNAHVCGTSIVSVTFSSGPNAVEVNNFTVDLDNLNNSPDKITLKGLLIGIPPLGVPIISVLSGLGTSTPVFHFSGTLPAFSSTSLTMQVQYSCDFFDMPPGSLKGYFINASGTGQFVGGVPNSLTFNKSTPLYDIGFTKVTPDLNRPTIITKYEEPFNIEVPLEIGGNFCDNNFMVIIKNYPLCFDFTGATYSILTSSTPAVQLPLAVGGEIRFEISAPLFGIPSFCELNYTGGLGELTLKIENVRIHCGCGAPETFYPVEIGFTPCRNTDAPADCLVGGNVQPIISTVQEVYIRKPVAGTLLVTTSNSESDPFSFCNSINKMTYTIRNTDNTNPVYNVDLTFSNQLGYQIEEIFINGTAFPLPFPHSNSVHLDFSDNDVTGYGFADLNDDGVDIYDDLPPGGSIEVLVVFSAPNSEHCGLGSHTGCDGDCVVSTVINPVLQATASWNDNCNSMDPAPTAALSRSVGLPNILMHSKYGGAKLEYNVPRHVTLEIAGGGLSGFDGYLYQGNVHRYLCIGDNLPDTKYTSITVNGTPVSYSGLAGFIDLGVVDPAGVGNTIIELDFTIPNYCPPDQAVVKLNFKYGVYFENCPDCLITLGCANAIFESPCSGNNSQCDAFSNASFTVFNDHFPIPHGVAPVKVYPCDCIQFNLNNITVAQSLPGEKLLVGIKVSTDLIDYFEFPYTYQGNISITPFGSNLGFQVDFLPAGIRVDIPNEPFSMIYFRSQGNNWLGAGNIISGHFTVCMDSDFPSGFEKIDFFAPVVGTDSHDDLAFCYEGSKDLYALDPTYTIEETVTASCETGGIFTSKLIKQDGELYGPDFPGHPRVIAQIINTVTFDVNNQYTDFRVLGPGCMRLPDPYQFSSVNLPQPSGQEAHGEVMQSFELQFEENCAGDVPVRVSYTVANLPGENCKPTDSHNELYGETSFSAPKISTGFDLNLGTVQFASDNLYILNTSTFNFGGDASNAWIQLEYDGDFIEIDPLLVTGPGISEPKVLDCGGGDMVLIIPIGDLANTDGTALIHSIPMRFKEPSCTASTIINLFGFHRCGCSEFADYHCAANYDDVAVCHDAPVQLELKPYNADLALQAMVCHLPAEPCDVFRLAVVMENNEQGNLSDVFARVVLPTGFTIMSASYQEGASGDLCVAGTVPVTIADLTGNGWLIPGGKLYGTQSGMANIKGKGRLYLVIRGCQFNLGQDDVTVLVKGRKPCGLWIEKSETVANVYGIIAPQNATLTLAQPVGVQYYCSNLPGSISGVLNFTVASFSNWTAFLDGRITVSSSDPGVVFQNPVFILDNPNTTPTFSIPFTKSGSCAFDINVLVEICSNICGSSSTCQACVTAQVFTIHAPGDPIGVLYAPSFPCGSDPNTLIPVIATVTMSGAPNIPIWNFVNASLVCDANANGVVDAGEVEVFNKPLGVLTQIQPGVFSATLQVPVWKLMLCTGHQFILTFGGALYSESGCDCPPPAIGNICCDCSAPRSGNDAGEKGALSNNTGNTESAITTIVSPNPSDGLFTLSIETPEDDVAFVSVYNQLGVRVFKTEYAITKGSENRNAIDLSQVPAGVYYLNVSANELVRYHKLVKQ